MAEKIMTATEVLVSLEALAAEHAPKLRDALAADIVAAIAEAAATAARAEIVAWLEWRFNRMQAMARDLCAEEITGDAGTYRDIADAIESGAPQRWAAEREGQGRG